MFALAPHWFEDGNVRKIKRIRARVATLQQLRETTVPAFLQPIPSAETLRDWFNKAAIPRLKTNPKAKRGGGLVFYSVPAVEKLLSQRVQRPGIDKESKSAVKHLQPVGESQTSALL